MTEAEEALIDWHEALCETHKGRTQEEMFDELGVDHIISGISVVRAEENLERWVAAIPTRTAEMCQGAQWRDGFIAGMLYAREVKK